MQGSRFIARSDSGKEYIIVKYQEYIYFDCCSKPQELEGLFSYRTSNGDLVNCIDSETFQIVETNEIVRKV